MRSKTPHFKKAAAQRARAGKLAKKSTTIDTPVTTLSGDTTTTKTDNLLNNLVGPIFIKDDSEECGYDGGVENWINESDEEDTLSDVEVSTARDSDEELLEYDEEIMEGLKHELRKASQYEKLIAPKNWAKVEAN